MLKNVYRNMTFTLMGIISIVGATSGKMPINEIRVTDWNPTRGIKVFLMLSLILLILSIPELIANYVDIKRGRNHDHG